MTEGVSKVGSEVIVRGATGGVKPAPHFDGMTVIVGRVELKGSVTITITKQVIERVVARGIVGGADRRATGGVSVSRGVIEGVRLSGREW